MPIARTLVTRSDMMTLCKEGRLKEAIRILDSIQQQSARDYYDTYICLLQECINTKALTDGKRVHAHMVKCGFQPNIVLGNVLVNMYAKCGSVVDARQVFDKMPERDLVSWNALIAGYVQHEHAGEAFQIFQQMQVEGLEPDKFTFVSILKACAVLAGLEEGKHIHEQIIQSGCESDIFVENALVNMYAKCGSMVDACQVFNKMLKRNVVSWNTMIAGYAHHGHYQEALEAFQQMQLEGLKPDKVTFINVVKIYACLGLLEQAKQIHTDIIKNGFDCDAFLGSTLVDMFAKCGCVVESRKVFDQMQKRDVVSWNVMIAGYVQNGHAEEVFPFFQQMQREGLKPDKVTWVYVLNACACLAALEQGKQIHADIIKSGCESDVFVGNALVDMYAKCGSVIDARQVFDKMPSRDVVSWNAMITGYARQGCGTEAFKIFWQMQDEGQRADKVTFIAMLNACVNLASLEQGKWIHSQILRNGCESDVFVGSGLVDMYAKCGDLMNARHVFDTLSRRNVVTWNAMITGYVQHGHCEEALRMFWQMLQEDVKPDKVTFVGTLNACASLAALKRGKQIHAYIIEQDYELDAFVGSALVDMYSKCGSVLNSRQIFDVLTNRNVVTYNAMIAGYAQHGHGEEALKIFEQMQLEGVKPDEITSIGVLSACSNAGLVDEGCYYYFTMTQQHGITPAVEHYTCMVDLLSRGGQLEEAFEFIQRMPVIPSAVVWLALLGACRTYGGVELAQHSVSSILELEPQSDAALVLLSNVYAVAGRWVDQARVRKMMTKKPGCSHIEVDSKMHTFVAEDTSHPQNQEILEEWKRLSRQLAGVGYVPDVRFVLHDVNEDQKELCLYNHSEKLAVSFGLISTSPGTNIHIIKNHRICDDCHAALKFVCQIAFREIVVRDASCFHHFKDGICSCGDYW